MSERSACEPSGACVGKQAFASPKLAHEVAKRRNGRNRPSAVYRCGCCAAWHIGTPLNAKGSNRRAS